MEVTNTVQDFLTTALGSFVRIEELAGDASTREYMRVVTSEKTFILCHDAALMQTSEKKYPFYILYNILKDHGIPIPEIYRLDESSGYILLQDLGDDLLEQRFPELNADSLRSVYKGIIRDMSVIQSIKGDTSSIPFSLSFDLEKLMFEFNFFIEHALINYFKANIDEQTIEKLRKEFIAISEILVKPDLFVLNHRDLHSRNVLIYKNTPYLIDFQDARMGLPQYDAVSLLRDSYVRLPDTLVSELMQDHFNFLFESGYKHMSKDEYRYYFDIMAFQRNIKAVGTFGYQVSSRGKRLYEKYIPQTLSYIKDYVARQDKLKSAAEILAECIGIEL